MGHLNINSRLWHWRVNCLAASQFLSPEARGRRLRAAGLAVSEGAIVQSGCFFFGAQAEIGDRTWIAHRCYFDTRAAIEVGDACDIGMEVMLCTSEHEVAGAGRRAGPFAARPIRIGDGTWIGTRSVVLAGVTIGTGCVIAAGAVVTDDCTPDGLYAGVPARRVRDLPD